MSQQPGQQPWIQALAALFSFIIYRFLQAADATPIYTNVFGGLSILLLLGTLRGLWGAFRWGQLLSALRKPSGIYGRVKYSTAEQVEEMGLSFSNNDGNGIPIASTGKKIIYWHGRGHASIRAPTDSGKSESAAALVFFGLGAHRNIIATAKGAELAWICGKYRKDVLKQNVIYINPWKLMSEHGLPAHDFNPVGHLVKLAAMNDPNIIDKAREIASILIPEENNASGENKIFRSQGRGILTLCLINLAVQEASRGDLCCNLPYLYTKLYDDPEQVKQFFVSMKLCEAFDGYVRRGAGLFLGKMERLKTGAESFLTEAQDALQIYDPVGPLGRSMAYSDFDPADLKNPQKPTSIFIILPPEKSPTHGKFSGLCLNALVNTAIEADRFEPRVTVVADEFANISDGPLPVVKILLMIGRSRGVQLLSYVQDTTSYKTLYGDDASLFTTQSELILAWGIRDTADADEYSKRSGQRSIISESGTIPISQENGLSGNFSIGTGEKGIPNLRPDEFMQLSDFTAALFYRQSDPVIVDLVSYRMVDPWRSLATPVPGSPPLADLPVKFKV